MLRDMPSLVCSDAELDIPYTLNSSYTQQAQYRLPQQPTAFAGTTHFPLHFTPPHISLQALLPSNDGADISITSDRALPRSSGWRSMLGGAYSGLSGSAASSHSPHATGVEENRPDQQRQVHTSNTASLSAYPPRSDYSAAECHDGYGHIMHAHASGLAHASGHVSIPASSHVSHSLQRLLAMGCRQWGSSGWWDGRSLLKLKVYEYAVYVDPHQVCG